MRLGAKKVMGLNLLGTCGAYLLLPFAAALGRTTAAKAYLMAGCLAVAGFCQAPLVPGQKTVQRNWLPPIGSASRPIHHKLVSLGELFGQGILANVSTATVVPVTTGCLSPCSRLTDTVAAIRLSLLGSPPTSGGGR